MKTLTTTISKAITALTFAGFLVTSANAVTPEEYFGEKPAPIEITNDDRAAIAYVVQSYVWALSNRIPDILPEQVASEISADFKTPKALLIHLMNAHRPLAIARDIRLDGITVDSQKAVQHAYITDRKKRQWRASYSVARGSKGQWRILSAKFILAKGDVI